MDAYKLIKDDIQKFIRTWLKTGMIYNPQIGGEFFKNKNLIQSKYDFYKTEQEYKEKFVRAYEENSFLVALFDGSCFQIYYEFEVNRKDVYLKKANICYLPCVTEGEILHEYLRLDYDVSVDNSFFHPTTHLHVGFREGMRIPADEIPLFSEFFEFVMYLYYEEQYLQIIGKKSVSDTYDKQQKGSLSKRIPISNELLNFVHLKMSNLK